MCGGGHPQSPFGFGMQQSPMDDQWQQMSGLIGMSNYQQQALGMMGMSNHERAMSQWEEVSWLPVKPKPTKAPFCVHCGRPAKTTDESSCRGCGSWEVEYK